MNASANADRAMRIRTDRFTGETVDLWRRCADASCDEAELGPRRDPARQRRNAEAIDAASAQLCREAVEMPPHRAARTEHESRIQRRISGLGEEILGWPTSFRTDPLGPQMHDASRAFLRGARRFADETGISLSRAELFQALRNVWIMNTLQTWTGRAVRASPSVVAYSLLYPVSDNVLDDPSATAAAKSGFSGRFGRRLCGDPAMPSSPREAAAFRLVEMIESEFPRPEFPGVFAGLLAIHRAQVDSLRQQRARPLPREDVLSISIAKGGASVLADGWLVAGSLTPDEEAFCFRYGAALQILDDLQDAARDRAAGHQTLFSITPPNQPLDQLACTAAHFTAAALRDPPWTLSPHARTALDLVRQSWPLLFGQAVADQPDRFTSAFLRIVESRFPVPFASLAALRSRIQRRARAAEHVIARTAAANAAADIIPIPAADRKKKKP